MKTTCIFSMSFIGFLLTYSQLSAQSINKNLDTYYSALNADHEMNGNVLAAQNGQILYSRSFGFKSATNQTPNAENSQFELASVSKLFTAIAVLQIKDKGMIGLDVPFKKYFPDFPYANITIRHLLAHTSGLPDIETLVDSLFSKHPDTIWTIHDDMSELVHYSSSHPLLFQPGAKWSYSSLGYHMLALLVEKISGQTLAVYTQENIFKPSGMNHSYIQTNFSQKQDVNRTKNYLYNNHYEMKLQLVDTLNNLKEWTHNLGLINGGSGIISTTIDLLDFDSALRSGKLLQPQTLKEACTPYRLNDGQLAQPFDITYCGLGWFIFKDTSHGRIIWGSGANPGTISFFASNLDHKQCLIVLHNVKCNPLHDLDALSILNGKPLSYHASLAFLYAHDLYTKKRDQADERALYLLGDTATYSMKENELDRVSLEFRRAGLKLLATETCEMHIRIFPNSADAFKDYARTVSEYGEKNKAIGAYKKVLELDPNDAESKESLKKLSVN